VKLKTLTVKGLVPFPEEQTVVFPASQAIAITGENGAGKTSLLDCIPLALFKSAPNRKGRFYEMFRGNDALVDLTFEMSGREYRIRRMINANSGTQKAWLYIDGAVVTEGKAAEFDEAVARHLGVSESAFLASVYHAQNGKGNPLSLDDRERRDLLTEVLGLHRFDPPLERVIEAAQQADRQAGQIQAKKEALATVRTDIPALEAEAEALRVTFCQTDNELADLEIKAQEARQRVANAQANAQGLDTLKADLADLDAQIASAQEVVADREGKIAKNKGELVDQAAAIRAAAEQTDRLAVGIAALETARANMREQAGSLEAAHRAKLAELATAEDVALKKVMAAERVTDASGEALSALKSRRDILESKIKGLEPLAGTIDTVSCAGTDLVRQCPLLGHARTATTDLTAKREELAHAEAKIKADTELLAGLWAEIEPLDAEHERLKAEIAALQQVDPSATLKVEIATNDKQIEIDHAEIARLAPLVKNLAYLDGVEERISNYRREIRDVNERLAGLTARRDAVAQKIADASNVQRTVEDHQYELAAIETEKATLNTEKSALLAKIGGLNTLIDQARETVAALAEYDAERARLTKRYSTLSLLREALGPKGARALKIDSAGPEISELVNALLRECYGQKFTILIKTQRQLGNGELREALEFSIIDNATGQETIVENKSGGEQAIIREVISLALCIYQRRRSGFDLRTLIRDEASAPLSELNTELYLSMLRKACEIGGFAQVLYVSHKSSAQALADALIHVEAGQITVKSN